MRKYNAVKKLETTIKTLGMMKSIKEAVELSFKIRARVGELARAGYSLISMYEKMRAEGYDLKDWK